MITLMLVAALAVHDFAELPPKKFDHVPTIPHLVIYEPTRNLANICEDGGTYADDLKAGYMIAGCEIDYTGGQQGDFDLMNLIARVSLPQNRLQISQFIDSTPGKWGRKTANLRPVGCIVVLDSALIPLDLKRYLRHEYGHCNGWSDKHEDSRPWSAGGL